MKKSLVVLMLSAAPLWADEGRIPLAAATTITVPGTYIMTSDFTGPVYVDASDVVLDLNGHTLTSATYGVRILSGRRRIVVKNGTILSGTSGVHYEDPTLRTVASISDVVISGGSSGIYLGAVESAEIVGCRISSVNGLGILLWGGAGNFQCRVERNILRDTWGMDAMFMANSQVTDNEVVVNNASFYGIRITAVGAPAFTVGGNLVARNTILGPALAGIELVSASSGNTVVDNTVIGCTDGILVQSQGNRLSGNLARGNSDKGIELNGANNVAEWNSCTQNGTGLSTQGTSRYRNNMLLGNTAAAAGGGDAGGNIVN